MNRPEKGGIEVVGLRIPEVLHPLEIGHLGLHYRIDRALRNAGYNTLGDLESTRRSVLLGIKGLGPVSVRRLYELLHPWRRQVNKQNAEQAGQGLRTEDGAGLPYSNIPLDELQLSNRAVNALRAAGLGTVGEVWQYQNTWLLEELHNVGVKTAAEIENALYSFFSLRPKQPDGVADGSVDKVSDMTKEKESIRALPIQVLQLAGRARSVLGSANIRTVGDLLKVQFGSGIRSLSGVGPSAARHIEGHLEAVLSEISDLSPEEIVNATDEGPLSTEQTKEEASERGIDRQDTRNQGSLPTAADWWAHACQVLTERERTILLARYPEDPDEQATLEEIGVELGVTRERVRQLRNRALDKLREATQHGLLSALDKELWSAACRGRHFVRNTASGPDPAAYASFTPVQRMAIDILAGGFEAWLDNTCKKTKNVWFRASFSVEQLERWAGLLNRESDRTVIIPAAEMTAPGQEVPELVAAAAEGIGFFSGHFCRRPLSANRRRAAVAHTLLSKHGRPTMPLRLAWQARSAGLLNTTASDLLRTLDSADFCNLFLDCGDYGYAALGRVKENSQPSATFDYFEDVPDRVFRRIAGHSHADEETVAGTLQSILGDRGPLKSADLLEAFESHVGEDYARSGAAAILTILPQFVRLAPGVYGLFEHVRELSPTTSVMDDLLNTQDLYWYAVARFAGEPLNAYALWTPAMEYRWARWALENDGNVQLLNSLSAVIEPDAWPVSDRTMATWKRRTTDRLEFTLVPGEPGELPLGSIDLWDVLSVAAVARATGSMNWVRANRIIGRRIDSKTGAGVIAVLILAGELEPSVDWRRKHRYLGTSEILGQWAQELASRNLTSQQTDVGNLPARFGNWHDGRRGTGWVQAATLDWPAEVELAGGPESQTDLSDIDEAIALVERRRKLRRHLQIRDTLLPDDTDE